jgi:hypothetical protein
LSGWLAGWSWLGRPTCTRVQLRARRPLGILPLYACM